MKILRKAIDKNLKGSVKVLVESEDDLWHLYHLVAPGDNALSVTQRLFLLSFFPICHYSTCRIVTDKLQTGWVVISPLLFLTFFYRKYYRKIATETGSGNSVERMKAVLKIRVEVLIFIFLKYSFFVKYFSFFIYFFSLSIFFLWHT